MNKNKIVILIPAYNPDTKLLDLTYDLIDRGFTKILIINDGSSPECLPIFKELGMLENVEVRRHVVNQGKGRVLKSGFNIILNHYPEALGCVTVDADGQHLPQDIEKMSEEFISRSDDLILGVRDFGNKEVPFRSFLGNKITKAVMNLFIGLEVEDTQTGLRAISKENMKKFMKTTGETYEFETNMLIDSKNQNIAITQVPIETVYIEENKSSHFNPIRDSLNIYKVFLKYILSSLSSAAVDIVFFGLFINLFQSFSTTRYILMATICARSISVLFNFHLNSKTVFRAGKQKEGALYRYIGLAIIQMLISAFLVYSISHSFMWNETITKIFVDLFLFFISFIIQREIVFVSED